MMLDSVQPEQQNKTHDLKKTLKTENIEAEDNAEQNK